MHDYDDHYIPNKHNAHIDTAPFSDQLAKFMEMDIIDPRARIENIYLLAFTWTNVTPEQPSNDDLICRYLSPNKFLKFLSDQEIFFPTSAMFSDPWECTFHPDYESVIERTLSANDLNMDDWNELVEIKKTEWNVSCWTPLESYHDDHLLWSVYAGGPDGVGITIRYGVLLDYLKSVTANFDVDDQVKSGRVSYSDLKLLPFNKHPIFSTEKEIRFAFRHYAPGPKGIDITPIRDEFGVRISPAASYEHYKSVKNIWKKVMGNTRVQWPGRS